MKALVLCGGHGTRLRPITHTSAKQLVPIANKPVLYYGLEALRDAGIEDVGIIVGDTAAEVRRAVGDGSGFGLRVTYIEQEAPLGLAHAVLIARDYLGDDDFVMYLGDNFLVDGLTEVVDRFRATRPDVQIMLTPVADPSQFGVAELDADGRLVRVEEKPRSPRSDLAIMGIYLFTPVVHEAVRSIKPDPRGELEITTAIEWLLEHDARITSHIVHGYWKDTGRVEDMLECNRLVLEDLETRVEGHVDERTDVVGRVVVEEGARISGSRLVGPLIIGADAVIKDSYVGPFTSIGPDCLLADTEVEFSIVMERSSVLGVRRLRDSLIGKDVAIKPASVTSTAHQLVLGDHSQVRIA
ncbi:glucose-1-phosphate thymidylyltransferase [Actinomadura barringtoniae]|uniref:Glucose-1-phosphate thymidylyltransferase n=1 Tax=Actinomadura barringtoniae TaxID=1427535 RepID=A0A939T777_9ACTN|nr:glucose-1-phosphate thymidylyltransferase [Actinomadura barringtoniae]MBO2445600.1 glucose-1-phosphate thymidylyltransferase [Actinomadura barringtoniae]